MEELTAIQKAFTRQSTHYDELDFVNPVLTAWRKRVYAHAECFLPQPATILELNAGTGIDALHFAALGHRVTATDISPGMTAQLEKKLQAAGFSGLITATQASYEDLGAIRGQFDFVFSNMGGLNCCDNLQKVTQQLPRLVKKGGFITWVIMPPCCPWEWLWILKGNPAAFRRLRKVGAMAHVEGEHFKTYYHSLRAIRDAFGRGFRLVKAEGLGAISPVPGSVSFISQNPRLSSFLNQLDKQVTKHFPFNRWADHIMVTFQFTGS